jgi:hypothetical protein
MRPALVIAVLAAASCQTRTQATVVTIGTGSIAVVGGYYEYTNGAPPLTAISAGAIAVISAASIYFPDNRPRVLFDTTPRP